MSTITAHPPYATLINVFTVDPARSDQLVELLDAATEAVMRHVDGFISANIHISADGSRVVNYAQWASPDAYQAMLANPVAREHMTKAADIAISFDPNLYDVASVHSR